jgi:hypothetical protein
MQPFALYDASSLIASRLSPFYCIQWQLFPSSSTSHLQQRSAHPIPHSLPDCSTQCTTNNSAYGHSNYSTECASLAHAHSTPKYSSNSPYVAALRRTNNRAITTYSVSNSPHKHTISLTVTAPDERADRGRRRDGTSGWAARLLRPAALHPRTRTPKSRCGGDRPRVIVVSHKGRAVCALLYITSAACEISHWICWLW